MKKQHFLKRVPSQQEMTSFTTETLAALVQDHFRRNNLAIHEQESRLAALYALPAIFESVAGQYSVFVHRGNYDPFCDPENIRFIAGFGERTATLYVGKVAGFHARTEPVHRGFHYSPEEPVIDVEFADGCYILHDTTLELRHGSTPLPATDMDQECIDGQRKFNSSWNEYITCNLKGSAIYVGAGNERTLAFLREIGYKGSLPEKIEELFAALQSQKDVMDAAAQKYFFE